MSYLSCYPTPHHQAAAEAIAQFFSETPDADAVLLVNSCARGKAVPDSCLDIAVLLSPEASAPERGWLEDRWRAFSETSPVLERLRGAGRFSYLHLDFFDGVFEPTVWGDGGGPDGFELEIGNRLNYAVPLSCRGTYLQALQARWLPYYDEDLRNSRLNMVVSACANDLNHVPWFAGRGLHFASFDRLYRALQVYLQALFISRRTYPIAYNKWIREQVVEILGLPDLYPALQSVLQVPGLSGGALEQNARALGALLDDLNK